MSDFYLCLFTHSTHVRSDAHAFYLIVHVCVGAHVRVSVCVCVCLCLCLCVCVCVYEIDVIKPVFDVLRSERGDIHTKVFVFSLLLF